MGTAAAEHGTPFDGATEQLRGGILYFWYSAAADKFLPRIDLGLAVLADQLQGSGVGTSSRDLR